MTKSLLFLLKLSIIPLLALVLGKLIGIALAGALLNIEVVWNFSSPISFLNPIVAADQLKNVMTFADLFMYACVAIGMSVVVIQSSFLHDSHLDVNIISKLANLNLLSIVKSSYEIYHWGFIWTVYLVIATLVIFLDVMAGNVEVWLAVIGGIFSILSIMILIKDAFSEIEIAKAVNTQKNYERQ